MIFFAKSSLLEKKAWNKKQAQIAWKKGKVKVKHFPLVVYLEATSVCNLSCPMCPVAMGVSEYQYEEKFLDLDFIQRLKPVLEYAQRCFLSGGGEPFLHPKFFELAKEVKQLKLEVILNTNGTLIDSACAKELVELELDCLSFSIDAINPDTYRRIRRGAELEQVVEAIKLLGEEKKKQGKSKPYLNMQFTLFKENLKELDKVVEFASSLGINHLVVEPLSPIFSFDAKYQDFFQKNYVPADAELMSRLENLKKDALGKRLIFTSTYLEGKKRIKRCPQPWINFGVRTNGRIFLCCGTAEFMGTLKEAGFEQIWNGDKYKEARKRISQGKYPNYCQLCLVESRSPWFNAELLE